MCRYPNQQRLAVQRAALQEQHPSQELDALDAWDADVLLAGLSSLPGDVDASGAETASSYDWASEDSEREASPHVAAAGPALTAPTTVTYGADLASPALGGDVKPHYFDWPLASPSLAGPPGFVPLVTPSVEPLMVAPVGPAAGATLAPALAPAVAVKMETSDESDSDGDALRRPTRGAFSCRIGSLAATPATRAGSKRAHANAPCSAAANKKRSLELELCDSYESIKARMPVIDYANMTQEEIQVAKRERNRLAAEKYRRKGRDLIEKLQERCEQLMDENVQLRAAMDTMAQELRAVRELATRASSLPPAGARFAFAS